MGEERAPWRLAFLQRALWVGTLAGGVAGLIAGGIGSRIVMRIVALTTGREQYGELTDFEFIVGQITVDGTISLLFSGAYSGVSGGLLWLAVRRWLQPLGRWRGLVFGVLLLLTLGFDKIDNDNFDFTRFGSPALNVVLFALLFVAFGLLVVPLADWLERALSPQGFRGRGSWLRYGGITLVGLLGLLIGVSGFLFLLASDPLYGGPIIGLLLLALVLPRQTRWPVVALLAFVLIGTVGTLLSIGTILSDAYR